MPIKSDNTQGNPYHDESTGEFTSANGGGAKQEKIGGPFEGQQQNVDPTTNISNVQQTEEAKPKKKFKINLRMADVNTFKSRLQDYNKVASIPFLTSARDIEEHFEEFLTPEIVKNINSKFGMFSPDYPDWKYFNSRTDPDKRCGVNIFAACIGKKRWTNNYLKLIDWNEYSKLSRSYGHRTLFRGIRSDNYENYKLIADSYSSKENEMIYGSVGGVAYGIAVYASNYRDEANMYARGNPNHIMWLILNQNAKTMSYNQICRIRDDVDNYYKDNILRKAQQIFIDNGIEPNRASQMTRSLGITLGDAGFIAMLCGVEWYQAGSYHMIENLGSLYRLLDR